MVFPHDYDGNAEVSLNSLEAACEEAPLIFHSTPKVGAFQCQNSVWQDRNGNFYFLEVNSGPGLEIFNTLYNFGRGDQNTAMRIGTKKLAEALRNYIPSSM